MSISPVVGEVIVLGLGYSKSGAVTVTDQADNAFTAIQTHASASAIDYAASGGLYYKVSDGTETGIKLTFADANRVGVMYVRTYTGLATGSLVDASNEEVASDAIDTASVAVSATATESNGVAIAVLADGRHKKWSPSDSVTATNGFQILSEVEVTTNFGGAVWAEVGYTSTGSIGTTIATDDGVGSPAVGFIALLAEDAGVLATIDITDEDDNATIVGAVFKEISATIGFTDEDDTVHLTWLDGNFGEIGFADEDDELTIVAHNIDILADPWLVVEMGTVGATTDSVDMVAYFELEIPMGIIDAALASIAMDVDTSVAVNMSTSGVTITGYNSIVGPGTWIDIANSSTVWTSI